MTRLLATLLCVASAVSAGAQITLAPLAGFGGTNAWLEPGENGYTYLGTANNERGLAYNPVTKHLYLVSRTGGNNVRILNATTGEDIGALDTSAVITGAAGGTFPINMIAVAEDGAIYAANLHTNLSDTQPYRIYKWETEASLATNIFANATLNTARLGDTFDAIGSGAGTRLVAGFAGGSGSPAGSNGFTVIDPTTSTFVNVAPPLGTGDGQTPVGEYRLGITFIDADTVLGTQGGTTATAKLRLTDFAGTTGTVTASLSPTATGERALDYAIVGGVPLLATIETGGGATANTVRVYDFSNPLSPVLVATGNNTTAVTPNLNGVGQVKFGEITGNTATLYAMNTNNGIQAFIVTVPEPSSVLALALGGGLLAARRRRR